MRVSLDHPWLVADLQARMRVLSWSVTRPGFVTARHIVWREVRNADLPRDLDAMAWFAQELARVGQGGSVAFLTSRDIRRYTEATAEIAEARADAVATVGLSNAERVGHRGAAPVAAGTINIAVRVTTPLSEAALIETLGLAVQARTVAVMEHGPALSVGQATGTGTDCLAVAAPAGDVAHAGLHTAIGEAVGRAVLDAVSRGVQEWMAEQGG